MLMVTSDWLKLLGDWQPETLSIKLPVSTINRLPPDFGQGRFNTSHTRNIMCGWVGFCCSSLV